MSDSDEKETQRDNSELYFETVVNLPLVSIFNAEENEDCLFKERAKLFRYDKTEDPSEWKERGTGYMKVLRNRVTGQYRLLMRRDQTYKVCANHFIAHCMELRPNCNSERAFVWLTLADFADEIAKPESLGIRFSNKEIAHKFQELFEEGRKAAENASMENVEPPPGKKEDNSDVNNEFEKDNVNEHLTSSLQKSLHIANLNASGPVGDVKVNSTAKENSSTEIISHA